MKALSCAPRYSEVESLVAELPVVLMEHVSGVLIAPGEGQMQIGVADWLQTQTKSWGHQLQGLARALQVACPGCPASSPALHAACHIDDPTLLF